MLKRVRNSTQLGFVHFLLVVSHVAAFAGFAQAVALDGVGQDDGRLAFASTAAL